MNNYSYPAVILAGGRAIRLGGGDKVLRSLAGQSLLTRITDRLSPQAGVIAINANGDASRFSEYRLPVVADSVPGHPGPLAGILAAMDWATDTGAQAVLTVAADTPFIPDDLVARLDEQFTHEHPVLAASADDNAMRLHPTIGLWPVALREDLRTTLARGQRKVEVFTSWHDAQVVIWQATRFDPFFNINTVEDLRIAEQLAKL